MAQSSNEKDGKMKINLDKENVLRLVTMGLKNNPISILGIVNDIMDSAEDQIISLKQEIRNLYSEVNCRVEHGAESGGHLEYVQEKLKEILK
jgi:hypothetical protein